MLALALAAVVQSEGVIDPLVVEAIRNHPQSAEHHYDFTRRLLDLGESRLASRLLTVAPPQRNVELFRLYAEAQDGPGMFLTRGHPLIDCALPLQHFMFYKDDVRMDAAVKYVQDARSEGRLPQLVKGDLRTDLELDLNPPALELCVFLAVSKYSDLAARVFSRFVEPQGAIKAREYLLYVSKKPSEATVYFPNGFGELSTDNLVVHASLVDHDALDDATINALLARERFVPSDAIYRAGVSALLRFIEKLTARGRGTQVRAFVDRYEADIPSWIRARHLDELRWAPVLVKVGREDLLVRVASDLLDSINVSPATPTSALPTPELERVVRMFAFAGRVSDAQRVLAIMDRPSFFHSVQYEPSLADGLMWRGKYNEAIGALIASPRQTGFKIVAVAKEAMLQTPLVVDKRAIARRVVDALLAKNKGGYWRLFETELLSLGLSSELRSLLDSSIWKYTSPGAEGPNAFRCYLAIGDRAKARELYGRRRGTSGPWLIDALDEWDVRLHGAVAVLSDVDGIDIFADGLSDVKSLSLGGAPNLDALIKILQRVQSSPVLSEKVVHAITQCILATKTENRATLTMSVLQRLVPHDRAELLNCDLQQRLAALL